MNENDTFNALRRRPIEETHKKIVELSYNPNFSLKEIDLIREKIITDDGWDRVAYSQAMMEWSERIERSR